MISDSVSDKDLAKHRVIELDNGNKIHLERRDPYGFIHCWLDKGQFPTTSSLNGVFTSWQLAYTAVESYVADRNAAVSQIRQVGVVAVKETNEEVQGTSEDAGDFILEKTTEEVRAPSR